MYGYRPLPLGRPSPWVRLGSKALQITCKDTGDAASYKNLSTFGCNKVCGGQLEYISYGKPGPDVVDHQLPNAQSCSEALPTVRALGGDGLAFQKAFMVPILAQEDEIMRNGRRLATLTSHPPLIIASSQDVKTPNAVVQNLGLADEVGVNNSVSPELAAGFPNVPLHRAVLCTDAPYTFSAMVGADASFLFSLLGVPLQSQHSNIYDLEPRAMRAKFWTIAVMAANVSPRQHALTKRPDTFDENGNSWWLDLLLVSMRRDLNLRSQELTAKPLTEPDVSVGARGQHSTPKPKPQPKGLRPAKGSRAPARAAGAHAEQALHKDRWACPAIRALPTPYDHDNFEPGFDGATAGAADIVLPYPIAIREPRLIETLERELPNTCVDQSSRHVSLMWLIIMCSLHGIMRTGENNTNFLSAPFREAWKDDHAGARQSIRDIWNKGHEKAWHQVSDLQHAGIRRATWL